MSLLEKVICAIFLVAVCIECTYTIETHKSADIHLEKNSFVLTQYQALLYATSATVSTILDAVIHSMRIR